jgi:hypothetical protein
MKSEIGQWSITLQFRYVVEVMIKYEKNGIGCVNSINLDVTSDRNVVILVSLLDIVLHKLIAGQKLTGNRSAFRHCLTGGVVNQGEIIDVGGQKQLLKGVVLEHDHKEVYPVIHITFRDFGV